MVRMRDVLKSARDVLKTTPVPGESTEAGAGGFSFPRSSTSSIPSPTNSHLQETAQPLPTQAPVDSVPPPSSTPVPKGKNDSETEEISENKKLYLTAIGVVEEILQSVERDESIDLGRIEEQCGYFVDSLAEGDQLFMHALSARRTMVSLAQHSVNVSIIAIKIAFGLKYSREKIIEVSLASMIHEVGMVKIPKEVVNKKGELTPSEYELIKQHPIHGRNILERYSDEYPFLPIVIVQEHERWNGNGYPFGLKEDEIHEYAQVLGLADTFIALTHLRHYRDNFIAYKAIQSIIERRNIDFSAKMIKTLIDVISIFPVQSLVKLNDGCVARVVQTNKNFPVRPVIEVVMDAKGSKLESIEKIDLSKEPMIYIVSPVLDENAY